MTPEAVIETLKTLVEPDKVRTDPESEYLGQGLDQAL